MKRQVIEAIRRAHLPFAPAELPNSLAVYFHDLTPQILGPFRDAIEQLLAIGYRTVSPKEYVDCTSQNRRLFISFDDNYRSWYEALETLGALGVTCTFYVNTCSLRDVAKFSTIDAYFDRIDYSGDRTPLSRAELRELHRAGHNIGCHSHSHFTLSSVPCGQWSREIDDCKASLEDIIGAEVSDFSFPFGMRRHFSSKLRKYCRSRGFQTIATGISGQLNSHEIDPLAIHRTEWKFNRPHSVNFDNLRLRAGPFASLFGRSVIG